MERNGEFVGAIDSFSYSHVPAKYPVKYAMALYLNPTVKLCTIEKNTDIIVCEGVL